MEHNMFLYIYIYIYKLFKVLPFHFYLVLSIEHINYKVILFHESQIQEDVKMDSWMSNTDFKDFSVSTDKLEFDSLMSMCDGTGHKREPRGILGKQMTAKVPPKIKEVKKNDTTLLNAQHIWNKILYLKD